MRQVLVVLGLGACATGGKDLSADANPHGSDARMDGPSPHDAPPNGQSDRLLLSEVQLGPGGSEFIEVVNPHNYAVDLSHFYLSDTGDYFKLPGGYTVGGGDFIVKFPASSMIAAHAVVTVAIGTAAAFSSAFPSSSPTYSIADGTMMVVSSSFPSLTDSGEIIVLFSWDGSAFLVQDSDMMIVGIPTSGNGLVSKSGFMQGSDTYHTDSDTITAQASAPAAGKSTKRIMLDTGHENQLGTGNGIDGCDETSEDTGTTWDSTASFSAATPGQVPAVLLQ
jgi:hypothetical protein